MKIATYNVNSLRKRLPIVLEWLDKENPTSCAFKKRRSRTASFRSWRSCRQGMKSATEG